MKNLIERIKKLSRRGKVLLGIVAVLVLLLVIGGVAVLVAPDQVAELTSAMSGVSVSGVVGLYPDHACVALNQQIPIVVKGMEYGDPGRDFWSSDGSVVTTSSPNWKLGKLRLITGVKAGSSATVYIGGPAHLIADGKAIVHVRNTYADCWEYFTTKSGTAPVTSRGTKNESTTTFKFAFVSDTQGCNACSLDDQVANHEFNRAFALRMKSEQPAFIINGGDLSNYGNRSYMFFDDVLSQWTAADIANIPIYSTVGNHELVRAALGNYQKQQQNELPTNIYQNHYFAKGGPAWPQNAGPDFKNLAYSFRYGNSMFIVTDTFYMWGDNGNDTFTNGDMMYQGVDLRQLAFVDHEGQDAKTLGLSHAFVIGHAHTWFDNNTGDPAFEFSSRFREDLAGIMIGNTVFDAYITGHGGKLNLGGSYPSPTAPHPIRQLVAETGAKEINPNYYLSIEVNGKTVTVTPVSYDRNANVWAEVTSQQITWTKP